MCKTSEKFSKLSEFSCESVLHDPHKVIHNFSGHKLSQAEKFVLCKGLQFPIPPKRI